ncbi:unnamed protein product [Lactuca virosa]|uniref:Retrotransposon gag domain-containing protein n=1 Tax=Lactuca virosa TaxID=75947 RepID=A0AAU9PPW8_9ASTR|nr:unnamed protein product [Lactuca virosa]
MTHSILTMILKLNSTANSIWDTLEPLYWDNKHSHSIELDNELLSLVPGDRSITEYFQKMKPIVDLLANNEAPVPEKTLLTYMLNGLSPKFENISMLIRYKDLPPTFLESRTSIIRVWCQKESYIIIILF